MTSGHPAAALADHLARERFTHELAHNFSVIAPAGVGKTRAVVERVVNLATSPWGGEILPALAVVTYTNKAADEMQERARNRLLVTPGGAARMSEFNRAFFGTIHSFCLTLLGAYGHFLGLPGELELVEGKREDALWNDFFRGLDLSDVDAGLSETQMDTCFRHLPVQDVIGLARQATPARAGARAAPPAVEAPAPDFEAILAFTADRRNQKNVEAGKAMLRRWQRESQGGAGYLPLPAYEKGGAEFKETWRQAFAPLRQWLGLCSLAICDAAAIEYRRFRMARGQLTYADQIRLVLELLAHPEAGPRVRGEGHRIILDEAQDADPDQFRVLLELARPPDATGLWLDTGGPPPLPGRFCMVGDPQQSIYSSRADLGFYQDVRARLVQERSAEELEFHVTFRCDRRIIELANAHCPAMLNGQGGQVAYVPLQPRPDAGEGQVVKLTCGGRSARGEDTPSAPASEDKAVAARLSVNDLARIEAEQLAAWLAPRTPASLGARDWSHVAVLCARRRWITPLEFALQADGLPVQNQSRREVQGDNPAVAWLAALAVCIAEPRNGFEIVGLLREVFGIADDDLHAFSRGDGNLFQIEKDPAVAADGPAVARRLGELCALRGAVMALPLQDAARRIVAATDLRARLRSIAPEEGDESERILAALLTQAAAAEEEGRSFAEWADSLRELHGQASDPPPRRNDAVQLITCHAAKGLEWDVVIIPFLFRGIATRGNEYPFLIEDRRTGRAGVLFDKQWQDAQQGERAKAAVIQENQRLLYVALTRARRTLLLVDDRALFGNDAGSFASCLGLINDRSAAPWHILPQEGVPLPESAPAEPAAAAPVFKPVEPSDWQGARKLAALFPRRILPHALAHESDEAEPEQERERDPEWPPGAGEAAKRYGLWWHALMEHLDWPNPASWPSAFQAALADCPAPDRAAREWTLFTQSEAAKRLAAPGLVIHVEAPLLRPLPDGACEEGFIDLAAFDPAKGSWLVLDWKTNLVGAEELPHLLRFYAPQIREYVEAIRAATASGDVAGGLYSTACGKLLEL